LDGTYRLVDDPSGVWRPCVVVDLSTIGAGLELFGGGADASLAGRSLALRVHGDDGEPCGVVLRGEIRHIENGRVGIEFTWLSSIDSAVVTTLVARLLSTRC
jgi:hypothetical protein